MTITSTPSEVSYGGDDVSVDFPIPFVFDTSADLAVIQTDADGNPVILSSGFSIAGGAGSTGTLTLDTALPTGETLTILDDPERSQSIDYIANDAFPAESAESGFDRNTRLSKRLYQLILKSFRVNDGDPATGDGMLLGSVDNRKGKYLFFNAVTGAVEYAIALVTTALSQSIIAQLLNPQTPAEAALGVTPVNYWYLPANAPRYFTNTIPGTTDMTTAIQTAINVAAIGRTFIAKVPADHYLFSKLYFHYDAVNNPLYPQDTWLQGRVRLEGEGRHTAGNFNNGVEVGTLLESSDATGPAIYCGGDPLGADTHQTNQVQIFDLSLHVSNTTSAVKFYRVVQNSGFSQVYINQAGTGSGIDWEVIWNSFLRDVRVDGAGSGVSDTGVYIRNSSGSNSGGFVEMSLVIANDFATDIQLGHKTFASAARLHSVPMKNCQGGDAIIGIAVGAGMDQVKLINSHAEGNTTGIKVYNGAAMISIEGGSSINSDVLLEVGDGTADGDRVKGLRVSESFLLSDASTTDHVLVHDSANIQGIVFERLNHTGHASATETAYNFENAVYHDIRVISPNFGTDISNNFANADRLQELWEENEVVYSSSLSGARSVSPFIWRQGSSAGAQPVVEWDQQDIDEPFVRFTTPVTPGAGKHIDTTTAGAVVGPGATNWAFSRMVQVSITDGGGTTDYWMPVFDKV